MLAPFVNDKWYTSWLFCGRLVASLVELVCFYLEQNSHTVFSSGCHHVDVCLYPCDPTWDTNKWEKPLLLERHFMNAPSELHEPWGKGCDSPWGIFQSDSSQLFFQIAFSHLLWCLHFPWFRNYPDSQYKEYSLHSFMKENSYRTEKKFICKMDFKNPRT